MIIKKRGIVTCILLSIITCGIYGFYWYYQIADTMYQHNTPSRSTLSPGIMLLLFIVTGGLFGLYAGYKWGKQMPEVLAAHGVNGGEDRSVIYLILGLFELSIINFCLIQNDLNQIANA